MTEKNTEDTPEAKPKSLIEQQQERIQQLEMQKKQTEMGYAEVIGALSEARRMLSMLQSDDASKA